MLRGHSALEGVTAGNLDKLVMAVSTAVKESEWTLPRVGVA
jgi:hypothetical protein